MPVNINNINYLPVSELLEELEVTRQTLWRWRRQGKIPRGYRLRNRMVVFSPSEVSEIKGFANQLQPIEGQAGGAPQLNLFDQVGTNQGSG